MSVLPLAAIWLMVLATAPALAAIPRPRPLFGLAVAVPLLAFLPWLLARPDAAAVAPLLIGRLAFGVAAWQLTGVALLLLLIDVLHVATSGRDAPGRRLAASFALTAAGLLPLWAGSAQVQVMTTALFAAVWAAFYWLTASENQPRPMRPIWLMATAVLLRWGATTIPGALGTAAGLGAGTLLLVSGPVAAPSRDEDVVLWGLAPLVGASALASVLAGASLPPALLAAVTVAGLLILLITLIGAIGSDAGRALRPALAGLALLAGAWAGETALLPATRLVIFAPLLLALAAGLQPRRARLVAIALVYIAIAGLPLTVGIAALSRLYEAWRTAGGFVLLAVAALLLALWLAVLYAAWARAAEKTMPAASMPSAGRVALLVLPAVGTALGLLHWDAAVLATHPLVWAALALPALVGLALGRLLPRFGAPGDWLPALLPTPPAGLGARARQVRATVADAVADAIDLLEGANGLLLLMALVLLLWWLGR